ncbi:MAG: ABC transporter ATP-binding protein [Elioraea sp.]|nr:ABC transporter ATP-binding protein [Elioraea sp.]MDW8443645.1 ABC transporter ATP-binding protein [Acetobacteraceae bacterium]
MSAPILAVDRLSVSFRAEGSWRRVVEDLSFNVGPRETVAVVGESGSGKSVTALAIMRLLPPLASRIEGEVSLAGKPLLPLTEAEMRKVRGNEIAMIFQEPMTSLNPVLTVGFQVAETLVTHRGLSWTAAEAEALRLFERVRIPAARTRFHEHPHRFSGGMRQRVMIAMALACRPKLLIADEPTTALDVTIQAQILALIRGLQEEEGMSVLFITHDMGVVAEIADRVVVMHRGRAVEQAGTADLFAAPRAPYTRALLAAVPRLGSMAGEVRPRRFPTVDLTTGESDEPAVTPPTVDPAEPPLLQVEGLVTRFDIRSGLFRRLRGRVHAVEGVSFTLHRGETLALVGESGCGKSTTARSILRLVSPTAGRILFDGVDLMRLDRRGMLAMRRRMQVVFQDPFGSLNPRKRVGDALAEPIIVHGLADRAGARERVADLLRRVGLSPEMASRLPHEFSGGQRQRLCIARALALAPDLIVADEAVSALDVSVKAQVLNLLLDLQAELRLAYLFISHDIAVVERVSHRVAVMYLGEIVEIGPRAAIFGDPRHPYTKRLMAAVPVPDPQRARPRRSLDGEDVRSPVRPRDYVPEPRRLIEVSPGHLVREWGPEWEAKAA